MGKPLMIQQEDNDRIEQLKKDLGINKKIDVIRAALQLLENEAERIKRIKRWKHATKLVAKSSRTINKEFQRHSRIKSE
jgi:archaellum component FlaC